MEEMMEGTTIQETAGPVDASDAPLNCINEETNSEQIANGQATPFKKRKRLAMPVITSPFLPDQLFLVGFDHTQKRVVIFRGDGTIVRQFSDPNWQNPLGLCCTTNGAPLIYVSDGNSIFTYDSRGNAQGLLAKDLPFITALESDGAGVFIVNPADNNILRYNQHGKHIGTLDNWGDPILRHIYSIRKAPGGLLYVSFAGGASLQQPNQNFRGGVAEVMITNESGSRVPVDQAEMATITGAVQTPFEPITPGMKSFLTVTDVDGNIATFTSSNGTPWKLFHKFFTSTPVLSLLIPNDFFALPPVGNDPENVISFIGTQGGINIWQAPYGNLVGPFTWDFKSRWIAMDFLFDPS